MTEIYVPPVLGMERSVWSKAISTGDSFLCAHAGEGEKKEKVESEGIKA